MPLNFVPGSGWASLRDLCGYDEQSVSGTGTLDAIRLLDRLLVEESGTEMGPGKAKQLTTADRDRLLAGIYMYTYGTCIESTIHCRNCQEPVEIDFSLEKLITHLYSNTGTVKLEKDADGVFKLANGTRFRLPNGQDECEVIDLPPDEAEHILLDRCIIDDNSNKSRESAQKIMKQVAPVLDLDLPAKCPGCQTRQKVHFDIQYFLLTTILQEQKHFTMEVHRLASAYGWSLNEILQLSRRLRKAFVGLVESDMSSTTGRYL